MLNICYKNIFIYLFLLFLITYSDIVKSENIDPYCDEYKNDSQIKFFINYKKKEIDFKKIEINIENQNYRKWAKNLFKAYQDRESFSNLEIKEKYKKNYNARLQIKFNDELICNFKAKIKIHGSFIDHLSPTNNNTSIQVKIIDGNIYGIEEFILFKPASRNGINEVFINYFMDEMGFITPQTAFIKANIDGKINSFIFQEKINKNMLERNGLRESIILSADDRIRKNYSNQNNLALAKIDNVEWSVKNYDNFILSSKILSEINQIFLLNNVINFNKLYSTNEGYLNLHISKLSDKFKDIDLFELSAIIFDGGHALASHNRIFYYDYYNNQYIPILYDSQPKIFQTKNFKYIDLKNEHTWSLFFELNENHLKKREEFVKRFKIIQEDKNIIKKLNNLGILINNKELDKIFSLINDRLELIKSYPFKKNEFYKKIKKEISQKKIFYLNEKNSVKKYNLIFTNDKKEFIECDIFFINCKNINIKNLFLNFKENRTELLNNFNKRGNKIFIGNENLLKFKNFLDDEEFFFIFKKKFKSNDGKINFIYNEIKFDINETNKVINFFGKNEKVVFLNSNIEDWSINYSSPKESLIDQNFNKYNDNFITGCLNFFNSDIENIEIRIENTSCEDALNIISSKGNISLINISNAKSDALDFDFSDIKVQNLNISNALNDCLDFSFGNYHIDNINLSNCGDKAISVGENSYFESKFTKIMKSNNGIAVKDSSKAIFRKTFFNNINFNCFMTYRKKNEFAGSFLSINNFVGDCFNKEFKQSGSILIR